jgi:hypothetical protein
VFLFSGATAMAIQQFSFGLNDAKIAAWNSAENYGTSTDLYAIEMANVTFEQVSGVANGDDARIDVYGRIIGGTVRLSFTMYSLDTLAIFTGRTNTASALVESLKFSNLRSPYFAIAAMAEHSSGAGAAVIFVPKVKITGNIPVPVAFGQYWKMEVDAQFVYEGDTYGFGVIRQYANKPVLAIPLPDAV